MWGERYTFLQKDTAPISFPLKNTPISSGPCNSFHCWGHFKNVYDDDNDAYGPGLVRSTWIELNLTDWNKSTQLHDVAFIGHAPRRHDWLIGCSETWTVIARLVLNTCISMRLCSYTPKSANCSSRAQLVNMTVNWTFSRSSYIGLPYCLSRKRGHFFAYL